MTTPRARANQPYTNQPMDCAQAGCNSPQGDCLGFCTLHRTHPSQVEQVNALPINKEPPFEMHEPASLRDKFLGIFKKEWK
jgi:hypothetical protein